MRTIPWTAGLALACPACGGVEPPSAMAGGCAACGGPLETRYPDAATWRVALPEAELTRLGQVPTPLVAAPGDLDLLKLESRNPTGSHKDRAHRVAAALARLAGAPGLFTTSTGNHGVSCAAHAAREGLHCVVVSTDALPRPLARQIAAHGGIVALLDPAERPAALERLRADGWVAATSSDPALSGVGTPYLVDGYRSLVDELVCDLGRLPDAVSVPCASGDTLVGILRGLRDHAERAGVAVPTLLACQPAGAAALRASLDAGAPVVLAHPSSVARSTSDERVGRLAIAAARDGAVPVLVGEDAIIEATARLARGGLYVETSSALALAGAEQARAAGLVGADAVVVSVLTAQGRGWNEDEPRLAGPAAPVRDLRALLAAVAAGGDVAG